MDYEAINDVIARYQEGLLTTTTAIAILEIIGVSTKGAERLIKK